ncbi:hypothetical protein [Asaia prunellae]|uniref:hypothetical protein n=1 Tax=Asaia prunellae TaxID=610245 RepID=UPI000470A2A2|nr:hypothetical protein [Asaia prunellae]
MNAPDDLLRNIRVDGECLTTLYDQWVPQEMIVLTDDIRCLVMHDPLSGREAVWYLDGENNYCGSHIEAVQRLHPQQILSAVAPWFDDLTRYSLSASPVGIPDAPLMPNFLATQLAAAWCVRTLTETRQLQTALAEQDKDIAHFGEKTLSARRVRRLLGTRVGPESLVVLSPLTDIPLRSQISFVSNRQLVHRFYDKETDCSFYLSWWEKQLDQLPSFYCPKANLLVSDETMAGMLPALILGWYLSNPHHVASIADAQAFEARDYGLGQASALLAESEAVETTLPHAPETTSADMISESWAFLSQNPSSPTPVEEQRTLQEKKQSGRLFERLRSFVKKN